MLSGWPSSMADCGVVAIRDANKLDSDAADGCTSKVATAVDGSSNELSGVAGCALSVCTADCSSSE